MLPLTRYKLGLLTHVVSQYVYIALTFYFASLTRSLPNYFAVIVSAYLAHRLYCYFDPEEKRPAISLPFLAICNSIVIFLDGSALWVYALAGALGSFGRLTLRTKDNRPFFNPSVFAVVLTYVLVPKMATGSVWGSNLEASLFILAAGTALGIIVQRCWLSWSYMAAVSMFSLIFYYASAWFGFGAMAQYSNPLFYTVSLIGIPSLIFTFHVITDPRTSPASVKGQILFAVSLALLDCIFRSAHISFASLWAYLFIQGGYAVYRNEVFKLKPQFA